MISGHQIRMARTALRFGVRDVAARARVSPATVTRIEAGSAANATTLSAIRTVLEGAGAVFMESNGDLSVTLTKTGACCCDVLEIARIHPKEEAKRLARTRIDEFFEQLRDFEKSAKREGRIWAYKLQAVIEDRLEYSALAQPAVLRDCVDYVGKKIRGK